MRSAQYPAALVLMLLLVNNCTAADFYVSPSGSSGNSGTVGSPWNLQTALSHPAAVNPGDTIRLRGGTYYGRFSSSLTGVAGSAINLTSYTGEQAIIDGNKVITLVGSIPTSAPYASGSLVVSDVTGLSPGGVIRIEDEDIQVGAMAGNTLLVTRGWSGSTPTTHADGVAIKLTGSVLTINGSYTNYRGLVITDSNPVRGEVRGLNLHGTGMNVYGHHVKIINNIIHDNAQGIGFWVPAVDSEAYGNIIFNNGYQDLNLAVGLSNWINGHGIYTQNDQGVKTIQDNIVFNQFGLGMHAYSTNSVLNNFLIKGNVHFNDRFLLGGHTPLTNITLEENCFYNGAPGIGYSDPDNNGILIRNNYLPDGIYLSLSKNVTVTGNTFWSWSNGANAIDVALKFNGTNNQISDYTFANNTYYQPTMSYPYHQFSIAQMPNGLGGYCWFNATNTGFGYGGNTNSWQGTLGYDLNGTLIAASPSGVKAFVRPNQYDATRAHVVVYNWDSLTSVNIDLAGSGFSPGDTLMLRNAENYLNESVTVTSNASNVVTIPMTGWSIAEPIGANSVVNSTVLGTSTFPKFGVFVAIKTASAIVPPGTHNGGGGSSSGSGGGGGGGGCGNGLAGCLILLLIGLCLSGRRPS